MTSKERLSYFVIVQQLQTAIKKHSPTSELICIKTHTNSEVAFVSAGGEKYFKQDELLL